MLTSLLKTNLKGLLILKIKCLENYSQNKNSDYKF